MCIWARVLTGYTKFLDLNELTTYSISICKIDANENAFIESLTAIEDVQYRQFGVRIDKS